MEQNSKIITSLPQHTDCLVRFQCEMAYETEHLKLEEQLVRKAIHYLHQNQQYGFYLVGVNTANPTSKELPIISSLMLTFEHKESWWVQSVYVEPNFRRQGFFTGLFNQAVQTAKQKGVKMIRLYAQKENTRAKNTYEKLGMHITGQIFYGFDMVYSNRKPDLTANGEHLIKLVQTQPTQTTQQQVSNWNCFRDKLLPPNQYFCVLQNSPSPHNRALEISDKNEKLVGYCQYFYEFSEWRCGFISYVNVLYIAKESEIPIDVIVKTFMSQLLKDKDGLKTGAMRFLIKEKQLEIVKGYIPNGAVDEYDVMGIEL